ncbi:XRE family transcriptional regulator [Clostridium estertheticum]|uniref:Helix-turn-helix domain-containing protein n=1 Tax=Clostridium estertheticum TaxID=238834 RepID=A0A5N7IQ97_9CLOT|nr:helix-turn-helix transcriptional regulator [Clostridium estertheticum]MBU3155147.1 helix-turn-helix domain-containing protein [Clostridium estertheticum]MPQ32471.1 XRE family transcriptional regulator [Clostridium estertheticum]MPQ63130.1 XRE family transcriptional regulator [Clostridium estertheticum]WAG61201.1 helix-turn-helix domain-containing protein [Clostridium estertheticum]
MDLKQLRLDTGIKLMKLAEILEISRQQYSNIEKGKGKMNAGRIEKLSKKFNIEPLLILKAWEETKSNEKRC